MRIACYDTDIEIKLQNMVKISVDIRVDVWKNPAALNPFDFISLIGFSFIAIYDFLLFALPPKISFAMSGVMSKDRHRIDFGSPLNRLYKMTSFKERTRL